jgi:hypothetical protein
LPGPARWFTPVLMGTGTTAKPGMCLVVPTTPTPGQYASADLLSLWAWACFSLEYSGIAAGDSGVPKDAYVSKTDAKRGCTWRLPQCDAHALFRHRFESMGSKVLLSLALRLTRQITFTENCSGTSAHHLALSCDACSAPPQRKELPQRKNVATTCLYSSLIFEVQWCFLLPAGPYQLTLVGSWKWLSSRQRCSRPAPDFWRARCGLVLARHPFMFFKGSWRGSLWAGQCASWAGWSSSQGLPQLCQESYEEAVAVTFALYENLLDF